MKVIWSRIFQSGFSSLYEENPRERLSSIEVSSMRALSLLFFKNHRREGILRESSLFSSARPTRSPQYVRFAQKRSATLSKILMKRSGLSITISGISLLGSSHLFGNPSLFTSLKGKIIIRNIGRFEC